MRRTPSHMPNLAKVLGVRVKSERGIPNRTVFELDQVPYVPPFFAKANSETELVDNKYPLTYIKNSPTQVPDETKEALADAISYIQLENISDGSGYYLSKIVAATAETGGTGVDMWGLEISDSDGIVADYNFTESKYPIDDRGSMLVNLISDAGGESMYSSGDSYLLSTKFISSLDMSLSSDYPYETLNEHARLLHVNVSGDPIYTSNWELMYFPHYDDHTASGWDDGGGYNTRTAERYDIVNGFFYSTWSGYKEGRWDYVPGEGGIPTDTDDVRSPGVIEHAYFNSAEVWLKPVLLWGGTAGTGVCTVFFTENPDEWDSTNDKIDVEAIFLADQSRDITGQGYTSAGITEQGYFHYVGSDIDFYKACGLWYYKDLLGELQIGTLSITNGSGSPVTDLEYDTEWDVILSGFNLDDLSLKFIGSTGATSQNPGVWSQHGQCWGFDTFEPRDYFLNCTLKETLSATAVDAYTITNGDSVRLISNTNNIEYGVPNFMILELDESSTVTQWLCMIRPGYNPGGGGAKADMDTALSAAMIVKIARTDNIMSDAIVGVAIVSGKLYIVTDTGDIYHMYIPEVDFRTFLHKYQPGIDEWSIDVNKTVGSDTYYTYFQNNISPTFLTNIGGSFDLAGRTVARVSHDKKALYLTLSNGVIVRITPDNVVPKITSIKIGEMDSVRADTTYEMSIEHDDEFYPRVIGTYQGKYNQKDDVSEVELGMSPVAEYCTGGKVVINNKVIPDLQETSVTCDDMYIHRAVFDTDHDYVTQPDVTGSIKSVGQGLVTGSIGLNKRASTVNFKNTVANRAIGIDTTLVESNTMFKEPASDETLHNMSNPSLTMSDELGLGWGDNEDMGSRNIKVTIIKDTGSEVAVDRTNYMNMSEQPALAPYSEIGKFEYYLYEDKLFFNYDFSTLPYEVVVLYKYITANVKLKVVVKRTNAKQQPALPGKVNEYTLSLKTT